MSDFYSTHEWANGAVSTVSKQGDMLSIRIQDESENMLTDITLGEIEALSIAHSILSVITNPGNIADQVYGNYTIPADWKKVDNVHIWFQVLNKGKRWDGVLGYVFEKPDGTFTAPIRGELVDVVRDQKDEFRQLNEMERK